MLSTFLVNEVLDHIFGAGNRDYTAPAVISVGLSTADPTEDGSGIAEPSGNNYSRATTAHTDWTTASSKAISNANQVDFATPSGAWGTITHFFLHDGTNFLGSGALTSSVAPAAGQSVYFAAGDLNVEVDA